MVSAHAKAKDFLYYRFLIKEILFCRFIRRRKNGYWLMVSGWTATAHAVVRDVDRLNYCEL